MQNNQLKHEAVVIGGGISGLGSSYYLQKQGTPSIVIEHGDQIGGRAGFVKSGEDYFETGGKNFSTSWIHASNLLKELNIHEFEPQHTKFNLLLYGKILSFSSKPDLSVLWAMIKSLGVRNLFQFKQLMTFAKKNRQALNYASGLIEELEKKDNFPITKYFGEPLLLGPLRMMSIIMSAAEPEETYYSNLINLVKERGSSFSIKGGMQKLYECLEKKLTIQLNTTCTSIVIKDNKVQGIHIKREQEDQFISTSKVVLAVPAHVLPDILDLPTRIKNLIDNIRYFPIVLVNALYKENVFSDAVSSLMFSPDYHLGHCSANRHNKLNSVRYTFSGRKAREVMHDSGENLISLAEKEFSKVIPITSQRLNYHVQKHLGGICAYGPKYTAMRRELLEYIASIEGLEIAGDYLEGHNMEGCLSSAYQAAGRIINNA